MFQSKNIVLPQNTQSGCDEIKARTEADASILKELGDCPQEFNYQVQAGRNEEIVNLLINDFFKHSEYSRVSTFLERNSNLFAELHPELETLNTIARTSRYKYKLIFINNYLFQEIPSK